MSEINLDAMNLSRQRKGDMLYFTGNEWTRFAGEEGKVLSWDANGTPTLSDAFLTGMIMLWSGAIADIPTGWALCDGSNGTPNLRDKFVVGAGTTYAVGGTGGAATSTPSAHAGAAVANHSAHHHENINVTIFSNTATGGASTRVANVGDTGDETATLTHNVTQPSAHSAMSILPPYYALAYIMKVAS